MNSDAVTKLADTYAAAYDLWLEGTEYKGMDFRDMLGHLMRTSWQSEYEKFKARNAVILESRGFNLEQLQPSWYVARMFAHGAPTFTQVSSVYRNAFG